MCALDDSEYFLHFHFSTCKFLLVSMIQSVDFVTHPCVKYFFSFSILAFSLQTFSHCMFYPLCKNQSNPKTLGQQVRVGVHMSLHTESKVELAFQLFFSISGWDYNESIWA